MTDETIDREIFKVGTWNAREFTRDDITKIAEHFTTQQQADRVPIVLGHGTTDKDPAHGWIQHVYVAGDSLRAVMKLSAEAAGWIKQGKFKFCSVELLKSAAGWVLDKLALLGAARPGVATIEPLTAARRGELRMCFTAAFEGNSMNEVEQLRAENARLNKRLVEAAIDADTGAGGRYLPNVSHAFKLSRRLTDDAASWAGVSVQDWTEFSRLHPQRSARDEQIQGRIHLDDEQRARVADPAARLVELREEFAAKHNKDLADPLQFDSCTRAVFRKHPELAADYFASSGRV